jgi:hypothetical protein
MRQYLFTAESAENAESLESCSLPGECHPSEAANPKPFDRIHKIHRMEFVEKSCKSCKSWPKSYQGEQLLGKLQVREQLMNRRQAFNGLYLDNNCFFDEKIQSVATIQFFCSVISALSAFSAVNTCGAL